MKDIKEFINESKCSAVHPINERLDNKYKIYFTTVSAAFIYDYELSGQISDGHWENSRPYDHWKWVSYTEPLIGNTPGYTGLKHQKTYSCNWLQSYVKKAFQNDTNYRWAMRAFKYAKWGSIIPESEVSKWLDNYACEHIISNLPEQEVDNETLAKNYETGYAKKFWDEAGSMFTDSLLKKYYSSKYSLKDFSNDLKSAQDSINKLYDKE